MPHGDGAAVVRPGDTLVGVVANLHLDHELERRIDGGRGTEYVGLALHDLHRQSCGFAGLVMEHDQAAVRRRAEHLDLPEDVGLLVDRVVGEVGAVHRGASCEHEGQKGKTSGHW